MKEKEVINYIKNWLVDYSKRSKTNGFVVGISGGIDSALTSKLSALTGIQTLCVEIPINQDEDQKNRGKKHISWLIDNYKNVQSTELELTNVFNSFVSSLPKDHKNKNELCLANVQSRLRMTTLYYYAQLNNFLVLGTGNKVEDFGVGFYTKYGDGGVDLSPIADLLKSEVYSLSKYLKINLEIIKAAPTDGLWEDNKTDEVQLGASYDELEWAMNFNDRIKLLSERQNEVLKIYKNLNTKNQHKMSPIPVCKIPKSLK